MEGPVPKKRRAKQRLRGAAGWLRYQDATPEIRASGEVLGATNDWTEIKTDGGGSWEKTDLPQEEANDQFLRVSELA